MSSVLPGFKTNHILAQAISDIKQPNNDLTKKNLMVIEEKDTAISSWSIVANIENPACDCNQPYVAVSLPRIASLKFIHNKKLRK